MKTLQPKAPGPFGWQLIPTKRAGGFWLVIGN